MSPTWHFRTWVEGDQLINPLAAEQFDDSAEGWKPGESLVRECIQNSLDAQADGQVVVVTFRLSKADALPADRAAFWFGDLWPHLRARECDLPFVDQSPPAMAYLVVEDFGTKGLEGDVSEGMPSNAENRFFNFFRAEGLTGNPRDAQTGGSWGVGKSVFNRCSYINSFLALSSRKQSGNAVLFGKSTLRWHRIGSDCYWYEGKFGTSDARRSAFVLPVEDPGIIEEFCRDFAVRRNAGTAGLSVVMPIRANSLEPSDLVDIVIREYFYPIVSGNLVVVIHANEDPRGGSGRPTRIDAESIFELAAQHHRAEQQHVIDLARWAQVEDRQPDLQLQLAEHLVPTWGSTVEIPKEQIAQLTERFENQGELFIRVPVNVFPIGNAHQSQAGHFDVFLRQAPPDQAGHKPIFIRHWTVVPNVRRRALHNRRVYSIVRIPGEHSGRSNPLAIMLKAAELPSHTEWSEGTTNFESRYDKRKGQRVIEFVVQSIKAIVDALAGANQQIDRTAWATYFPVSVQQGQGPGVGDGPGLRRRPTPKVDRTQKSDFSIVGSAGGGVAISKRQGSRKVIKEFRVRAWYIGAGGESSHTDLDFDLRRLTTKFKGCKLVGGDVGHLDVEVDDQAFVLSIVGFDEKRDLEVDAARSSS